MESGFSRTRRVPGRVRLQPDLAFAGRMEIPMAKTSWFDDKAEHPLIHEQVVKLESFTSALADGVVTKQELGDQEQRLVAAMKSLEKDLDDTQHAKTTTVLVELT